MSEKTEITLNTKGMGDEIVKAVHASKSYVATAFLTLLLYYIGFFIIGLICNIVFLSQSNESKRITGENPSGRGCLIFLLWVHIIIPILFIFLFLATGVFAGLSGY